MWLSDTAPFQRLPGKNRGSKTLIRLDGRPNSQRLAAGGGPTTDF